MALPASVKAALNSLDPAQQKAFKKDYNRRKKSTLMSEHKTMAG